MGDIDQNILDTKKTPPADIKSFQIGRLHPNISFTSQLWAQLVDRISVNAHMTLFEYSFYEVTKNVLNNFAIVEFFVYEWFISIILLHYKRLCAFDLYHISIYISIYISIFLYVIM